MLPLGLADVAPVFVFPLQVLVLEKRLLASILLFFVHNVLVLPRKLALLQFF